MTVTNASMRVFALLHLLVALSPAALLAGCPADLTEVCSLPGALPEGVDNGRGSASLDGGAFDGPATWSPGSDASITIGLLTMSVAKDVTGAAFDDLLADNALPICVPQGERSDTSGNAAYNESPGFVTDAAHTGSVALLKFDNDVLIGRFAFDLVNSGSAQTLEFTDGVFAATRFE
jgi:hypothetical protein